MAWRWLAACRRIWREIRQPSELSREWLDAIARTSGRSTYEGPHWSITKMYLDRERRGGKDEVQA